MQPAKEMSHEKKAGALLHTLIEGVKSEQVGPVTERPNIMVDIETLGTRPGAIIFQIGLCRFSRTEVGSVLVFDIDIASCENADLKCEVETVNWWLKTSKTTPLPSLIGDERWDIFEALLEIEGFIEATHELSVEPPLMWALPAHFDFPLIEAAFRACAWTELPWHYRDVRCARTLLDAAKIDKEAFRTGVKHTVESDVLTQIAAVQAAWRKFDEK